MDHNIITKEELTESDSVSVYIPVIDYRTHIMHNGRHSVTVRIWSPVEFWENKHGFTFLSVIHPILDISFYICCICVMRV